MINQHLTFNVTTSENHLSVILHQRMRIPSLILHGSRLPAKIPKIPTGAQGLQCAIQAGELQEKIQVVIQRYDIFNMRYTLLLCDVLMIHPFGTLINNSGREEAQELWLMNCLLGVLVKLHIFKPTFVPCVLSFVGKYLNNNSGFT